jgi:hypothetical protein
MGSITETEKPTYGTFHYIPRGHQPAVSPHFYHLPPLSEFSDIRSLPLTNIRPSMSTFTLSSQGFVAVTQPSTLSSPPYTHASWSDETLLKSIYIPEIESLVRKITGARTIFTDQLVMRTNTHTEIDGLAEDDKPSISTSTSNPNTEEKIEPAFPKMVGTNPTSAGSPAPKVHLDFAPAGARTHLRRYHPETLKRAGAIIAAEDALLSSGIPPSQLPQKYDGPRWAMFSIWRPLKTVLRDPLALSSTATFPKEDYVPFSVLFPTGVKSDRDGEDEGEGHREDVYLAHGSQDGEGEHEWFWIKEQTPEEVLVIQLFDSEAEKEGRGVAGGVMHSAVSLEGTEEEEARESVEVRCCAIWD